jgi:hypothetical protein
MLGLRQLGDVGAGILQGDELAAIIDFRFTSGIISADADGHISCFKPQRPGNNDVAGFMVGVVGMPAGFACLQVPIGPFVRANGRLRPTSVCASQSVSLLCQDSDRR